MSYLDQCVLVVYTCLVYVNDVCSRLCSYQITMRHVIFSTWESSSPSWESTWYSLVHQEPTPMKSPQASLRTYDGMSSSWFRSLWISISSDLGFQKPPNGVQLLDVQTYIGTNADIRVVGIYFVYYPRSVRLCKIAKGVSVPLRFF